jgi:hypothetical protein
MRKERVNVAALVEEEWHERVLSLSGKRRRSQGTVAETRALQLFDQSEPHERREETPRALHGEARSGGQLPGIERPRHQMVEELNV